jgi:hypothetical protein
MKLFEILQSPAQYSWTQDRSYQKQATFKTKNGIKFVVNFKLNGRTTESDNELWDVGFHPAATESDLMTGKGEAIEVFSTVIDILVNAVKNKGIKAMVIQAALHEPSRLLLYKRLVNKVTAQLNWKVYNTYDDKFWRHWLVGE